MLLHYFWHGAHTVKQDATHLLITAMARCILQMRSANCQNDNQLFNY